MRMRMQLKVVGRECYSTCCECRKAGQVMRLQVCPGPRPGSCPGAGITLVRASALDRPGAGAERHITAVRRRVSVGNGGLGLEERVECQRRRLEHVYDCQQKKIKKTPDH